MKILVTGHLGFIGSHVYEYFTSQGHYVEGYDCLLYTSPSPRDLSTSRMPSSA